MAGKYTPLENYLRALPTSQREVTLGFEQIGGLAFIFHLLVIPRWYILLSECPSLKLTVFCLRVES